MTAAMRDAKASRFCGDIVFFLGSDFRSGLFSEKDHYQSKSEKSTFFAGGSSDIRGLQNTNMPFTMSPN